MPQHDICVKPMPFSVMVKIHPNTVSEREDWKNCSS